MDKVDVKSFKHRNCYYCIISLNKCITWGIIPRINNTVTNKKILCLYRWKFALVKLNLRRVFIKFIISLLFEKAKLGIFRLRKENKTRLGKKKSNWSKFEPKTEAASELGYSVFVWPNNNLHQLIALNISIVLELWRHDKYGRIQVRLTTSYSTKPKQSLCNPLHNPSLLQSSPSHLRPEYKHTKIMYAFVTLVYQNIILSSTYSLVLSLFCPGIH